MVLAGGNRNPLQPIFEAIFLSHQATGRRHNHFAGSSSIPSRKTLEQDMVPFRAINRGPGDSKITYPGRSEAGGDQDGSPGIITGEKTQRIVNIVAQSRDVLHFSYNIKRRFRK